MIAIKFVLSSIYFTFMNKIYKQIFGIPMGSPLSPIVADLVMRDLEEHFKFIEYSAFIVLSIHRRYYISGAERGNSLNPKQIQWLPSQAKVPLETEANHCLSFLDITLIRRK